MAGSLRGGGSLSVIKFSVEQAYIFFRNVELPLN